MRGRVPQTRLIRLNPERRLKGCSSPGAWWLSAAKPQQARVFGGSARLEPLDPPYKI